MLSEFDISGRTVIITGAARGIGRGIVEVLAEAGANVMVTALTDRYLRPLQDRMASRGLPIEILVADATDGTDWQRTIDTALNNWGHIDVLINNLGDAIEGYLVPPPGSDGKTPLTEEEWRSVVDINLTEAFLGCQAIADHFVSRRAGKVINISGYAARKGNPGFLAYSTAKAGVVHLTQTLAQEWAPYGITVNCIGPGSFPDPELATAEEMNQRQALAKKNVPLGRVGDPREVGLLTAYLVSDAANYITGETIYIDGGATFKAS